VRGLLWLWLLLLLLSVVEAFSVAT